MRIAYSKTQDSTNVLELI